MIEGLAAVLQPNLATFAAALEVGTGPADWRPAGGLRDRTVLGELLSTFGKSFGAADERALLSYWSQFYFASLIIPTVAAILCLGRQWPLGLDAVDFAIDGSGAVNRFRLRDESTTADDAPSFAPLIEDHLTPFIDACAAHNGLSRRTLWCNAGAMFDHTMRELSAAGTIRVGAELPARAAGAGAREPRDLFLQPHRLIGDGIRKRKSCCLRFKLPGVPCCGDICPVAAGSPRPTGRSSPAA